MAYIRASQGGGSGKVGAYGTFTANVNQNTTVNLGFRAKCLYIYCTKSDAVTFPSVELYTSDNRAKTGYDCIHVSDSKAASQYNLGSNTNSRIFSVDDTGFTFTHAYDSRYLNYSYYAVS